MKPPYTNQCTESCVLDLRAVPGAIFFPRRFECPDHGYYLESRGKVVIPGSPEFDKPNDYTTEVASPADLVAVGESVFSTY